MAIPAGVLAGPILRPDRLRPGSSLQLIRVNAPHSHHAHPNRREVARRIVPDFLAHAKRAPLPDDGPGHEQPDCPVDRPTLPRDLDIGVLGLDLLAEEARRLAGDVGDQRLGLRQLQLQFLRRNAAIFDLMSLAPCF